jgi:hypothetical protein
MEDLKVTVIYSPATNRKQNYENQFMLYILHGNNSNSLHEEGHAGDN